MDNDLYFYLLEEGVYPEDSFFSGNLVNEDNDEEEEVS